MRTKTFVHLIVLLTAISIASNVIGQTSKIAYMDIHSKYSHSESPYVKKNCGDWGDVISSEKNIDGDKSIYIFTYNTGWKEYITILRCPNCSTNNQRTKCRICNGNGSFYGKTFQCYPTIYGEWAGSWSYDLYGYATTHTCCKCDGKGYIECSKCHGTLTYATVGAVHDLGYLSVYYDTNLGGCFTVDHKGNNQNVGPQVSQHQCISCNGSGKCSDCAGRGEKYNSILDRKEDCGFCRGRGICPICHGTGR